MQPHTIILLEGSLSLGVPLAIAIRELWLLRHQPPGAGRPPPKINLGLPPDLDTAPGRLTRVLEDA